MKFHRVISWLVFEVLLRKVGGIFRLVSWWFRTQKRGWDEKGSETGRGEKVRGGEKERKSRGSERETEKYEMEGDNIENLYTKSIRDSRHAVVDSITEVLFRASSSLTFYSFPLSPSLCLCYLPLILSFWCPVFRRRRRRSPCRLSLSHSISTFIEIHSNIRTSQAHSFHPSISYARVLLFAYTQLQYAISQPPYITYA